MMGSHGSVLIADRDPMVSLGLSSLIDWTRYNLDPEENDASIHELELNSQCQLILCEDLLLETLSEKKKNTLKGRQRGLKLIILTQKKCLHSYEMAFGVKADELLEKPVDMNVLTSLLEGYKRTDFFSETTEDSYMQNNFAVDREFFLINMRLESKKIQESFERLTEDFLSDSFEIINSYRQEDQWFYTLCPLHKNKGKETEKQLKEKIQNLISMIFSLTGESATAAISSRGISISDLPKLKRECEDNMIQQFYEGNRKVFSQSNVEYRTTGHLIEKEECENLINLVRDGKTVQLKKKIHYLMCHMEKNLFPALAKHQLMDLMVKIMAQESVQNKLPERAPGYFGEILAKLNQSETLEDSLRLVSSTAEEIADRLFHYSNQHNSAIIARVKTYMEDNFRQPITIETVAKHCYISPGYLSRLFKMQCGLTCQQYLIKIRLDHARRLLLDSPYKTSEIAEKSGIYDPNYFSRLFKKNFHMSPTQYREKHLSC